MYGCSQEYLTIVRYKCDIWQQKNGSTLDDHSKNDDEK